MNLKSGYASALACVIGSGICASSEGSISLVSQARSVSAVASIPPITDTHSDSAPDLLPWSRAVTSTAGAGSPRAMASASQDSSISASAITGNFEMSAQRVGSTPTASASSSLNVVFDVLDAPADYSIAFTSFLGGDNSGAAASALLTGPSGTVFSWSRHIFSNTWPTSPLSGTLPLGRYTLDLSVGSSTGFGDQLGPSGSITWNMSIPSPGWLAPSIVTALIATRRKR